MGGDEMLDAPSPKTTLTALIKNKEIILERLDPYHILLWILLSLSIIAITPFIILKLGFCLILKLKLLYYGKPQKGLWFLMNTENALTLWDETR